MESYATYILYSKALDKYYIGSTSAEISQRLRRHLSNHSGFTARAKDWEVVYIERYGTYYEARQREKLFKSWKSVTRINELIYSGK